MLHCVQHDNWLEASGFLGDTNLGALFPSFQIFRRLNRGLPEEFEAFGRSQEDEFTDAISDMEELSEYLEYAEDSMDDYDRLVEAYGQYKDIQDYMKGVNYYANFNYWFAEWDEEMTEYVQKEVTSEIKSCISEDFVWENDRDVVERKAMRYMDDLEDYIEVLAKNTGEERERKLEQELGEQMKK